MIILQKAKVHNDRTLPFQFGLHEKSCTFRRYHISGIETLTSHPHSHQAKLKQKLPNQSDSSLHRDKNVEISN